MNIDALENAGVTVRRFCGVPVNWDADENMLTACDQEAVGELIAMIEDDVRVPVAVCQKHLDEITQTFEVDNTGNVLLD